MKPLDIIMPEEDGFLTADEYKKDPNLSKKPNISVSSFSGGDMGPPFPFEVDEYVMKSAVTKELIGKVKRHLQRKGL